MTTRSYYQLSQYHTFEDRYDYLKLRGRVGDSTFGYDRYINQQFYTSNQWRRVRDIVIARDDGCDLGIPGYEIHDKVIIHHMNPMTLEDLESGDGHILDPDYLITTTHQTHNAIHFGDKRLLRKPYKARVPGDTQLWSRR